MIVCDTEISKEEVFDVIPKSRWSKVVMMEMRMIDGEEERGEEVGTEKEGLKLTLHCQQGEGTV